MTPTSCSKNLWRRRDVIKCLGATAIAGPVILRGTSAKVTSPKIIKIGHVSSQTGALAPFAEADPFILDQIRTVLAKGITNGGGEYQDDTITQERQTRKKKAHQRAR